MPEHPTDDAPREAKRRSTYDRALDMLEARSRGVAELRRLLVRKGESEDEVDAAIERLRANGLLDDANFARQLTRSKALGAGQSRRRIAQELGRRGVDRTTASEAIEQVFEDEEIDEAATVERVARKKLRTLAGADALTVRRRLYAYLARRGYDIEAINRVVSSLGAKGADEAEEVSE
ncbi:MAG TPA: regulatory protein RecX [Gemmatimonadaceae bacterium]|jgi:regulatory protein